ncbi:MAG TPA: hypothetical protein VIJ32_10385 [Actinomycetes bacterium]|jgi:hypothetical protein
MQGKKRHTLATVGAAVTLVLLAAACGSGPTTSGATRADPAGRGGVYRTALTDFGFSNNFDPTGE